MNPSKFYTEKQAERVRGLVRETSQGFVPVIVDPNGIETVAGAAEVRPEAAQAIADTYQSELNARIPEIRVKGRRKKRK